ncbi:unnamed protein product [Brassicogethes aeneus]|uniref:Integrase catalytic domain-containing protein n=1 Tax=Brassicogethes aeneus TaxID=1431903 RepID=A0A9P0FE15_BRAAE|nr:unnamed protein product [Brassicogethes aeneus]
MSNNSMSNNDDDYFGLNNYSKVPKLVEYDDKSEDEYENFKTEVEAWSSKAKSQEMADNQNKIRVLEDIHIPQINSNNLVLQEKLIKRFEIVADKLSEALNSILEVMKGANTMLTKISEISKSTLETEKLRLKNMEAQKTLSVRVNNIDDDQIKAVIDEIEASKNGDKENNSNNNPNSENQDFLDKSMQVIKTTIESGINNTKINIKRDYRLSQKSNFELWLDYLKSELQSNDLLDVIDANLEASKDYSEQTILKRKGLVRDIIINHLDENYHKRILNEKEPKEILKRLRVFKKGETNVTHTSVRARLYQIKMGKEERVIDFCERFDSIVREYESSEDAVPLTEQEKRSSFYQAVSGVMPELRNVDLIRRQTSLKEMNLDEIKSFITQLEAEKRSEMKEEPKVQKVSSNKQETKCHRCNEFNHWAIDCPLQGSGKWFCYYCQCIRTHKGSECHLAKAVKRGNFRGKYNKSNKIFKNKYESVEKNYPKTDDSGKISKQNFRGKCRGRGGVHRISNKNQPTKLNKEGTYDKPNWTICFITRKNNIEETETLEYNEYTCKARIISNSEFPVQSQISNSNKMLQEGEPLELEEIDKFEIVGSAIGRENKLEFSHSDFEVSILSRKPIQIDNLESIETLDGLYCTDSFEKKPKNFEKINEAMLWHVRLGHASLNYLKKLQKLEKKLEKVNFNESILECEICIMAKMDKLPFTTKRKRAERQLQLIHTDTMGPIKPISYPGLKKFVVVFIDDYSRLARAYTIKTKDESGQSLERYLISARNLLGKNEKVCYIRSDQGTEFMGGKFMEVMEKEKIENDPSPPYTPEHNGVAERFNQTIQEKVRAYMFDSGLPKTMWELAVEAAVHAYNRTPHKSIDYQVPLQMFSSNVNCHFEQIKRFGCIGYIKVPKPKTKFDARAIKAVLVGYTNTGYILWHPNSRKFLESRHVRFNEKLVYKNVFKSNEKEQLEDLEELEVETKIDGLDYMKEFHEGKPLEILKSKEKGRPRKKLLDESKQKQKVVKEQRYEGPVTRGRNKRKSTSDEEQVSIGFARPIQDISFAHLVTCSTSEYKLVKDDLDYCLLASLNKDPITYQEAISCKDKLNWKKAILEEIESLNTNKVWRFVDRPKVMLDRRKANVIDSKWIFKRKLEADGTTRFKARLVIRGFKDKRIYDLKETYAPVSRLSVVRSVLATINKYSLFARQLDVKTAFLNGVLDEEVYMEIPDGIIKLDDRSKQTKVCKLEKALYGLKISPKKWNKKFTEEVSKFGLENDLHEPCLFTWRKEGKFVVLILYVDDMLVASNNKTKLGEIINQLGKVFDMKDLGEPNSFLGMTIERNKDENYMKLHQENYIESVLEKFNMNESKPQSTPMVTTQVTKQNKRRKIEEQNLRDNAQNEESTICKAPYREAIGSLMYLANATRPDIAFAVNYLARKQLEPTEDDWTSVKRIFRYLRGTSNFGLIYRGKKDNLEAMTDASFRDCEDSTSTSGYVIGLYGDVIGWRSHKQSYVTLSTCQAEYLAMSEACQELISLDKGIRFIIGKTLFPITIWCDNRSARDCTKKDGSHKLKMFDDDLEKINKDLLEREKTGNRRHMADTHGDFVKSCVDQKLVRVLWINTRENLADIMTKPLPLDAHKYLRDKILNQS